jgi:type VII secretion-associated serine protease mycosin
MAVIGAVDELGVVRLSVPPGKEADAASRLQRSPLVEWAEPDRLRSAMMVPNDQLYKQFQWNLRKIGTEQAWDVTTGSPDLIVAVLDTGVDSSHPDLAGRLVPGYDFLNDNPDPADDGGHGTHNAGVIGAATNNGVGISGMTWQTRIMPLKVLNSGGVGPDAVIAKGIAYAVDHGARVINMSFGSATTSQTLSTAVRYAYDKGALLVAAAGNTAKLDNAVIYPAAFEQVLAVGATDESDKVADFSQHHPYVGVSAPGMHIVSTFWRGAGYGSYVSASGTSSAAPHVSGLAALILSANPTLTNSQVRQIIESTADDLGAPGKDEYYGTGRINARKALLATRPGAAIPTVPPSAVPAPAPPPAATPATLPRTVSYFAEGSTAGGSDLWLLLQNPNLSPAVAKVTYVKTDGSRLTQDLPLLPESRTSIYVNQIIPDAELSMKVESDSLIFAERSCYFGHDGYSSTGAPAPSTNWYMAEGSTRSGFDTWILLQNPLGSPANVTLSFLTSDGKRTESKILVPPTSTRSVYVNQIVPNSDLATIVASDQPIVAERSMYFGQGGGHGGVAARAPSRTWYLAEGITGGGYDTWLMAMNPNQASANVKVTYMLEDGSTVEDHRVIAPGSRLSIWANDAIPAARFGARVESDRPIVIERSTYFSGGQGGHNVVASPTPAQEWYLPEGSTKPPFHEEIAVLNPSDHSANLVVTFMKVDGTTEVRYFAANPTSRLTLDINDLLPDTEASVRVVSDVPVAVERAMYFAGGRGGPSSFGIPT